MAERVDYLVAKKLGVSRSVANKLIEEGKVILEGQILTKPSQKFDESSNFVVDYSPSKPPELELKVLYEDEDCVVIDKPAGILSHAKGVFSEEATVATWLKPSVKGFDEESNRAGIVHRLDRNTSGVMLCAKNPETLAFFQKQFSTRKVKKQYYALVAGELLPPHAIIEIPIERNPKDPKRFRASNSGKSAVTGYTVIKNFTYKSQEFSLVELSPKTGRTHQLRVHLAYIKKPIIGDDFYSGLPAKRLYLHARSLEITLPTGERKIFMSELPKKFEQPELI